nr:MAG TPA: hypothetical protein [Caudoviricetes sp.]
MALSLHLFDLNPRTIKHPAKVSLFKIFFCEIRFKTMLKMKSCLVIT